MSTLNKRWKIKDTSKMKGFRGPHTEKTKVKIKMKRANQMMRRNWSHSDETKKKLRSKGILQWQDPVFRKKYFIGLSRSSPNKSEKYLQSILNEIYPKQYIFVGNGKKIIGTKIPDFIHKHKNKIIEFWGDHWHQKDIMEDRINYFECFDYDCLIIRSLDLYKDLETVKNEIISFNNS
jgi:very-short-patch-repair endonuclease